MSLYACVCVSLCVCLFKLMNPFMLHELILLLPKSGPFLGCSSPTFPYSLPLLRRSFLWAALLSILCLNIYIGLLTWWPFYSSVSTACFHLSYKHAHSVRAESLLFATGYLRCNIQFDTWYVVTESFWRVWKTGLVQFLLSVFVQM